MEDNSSLFILLDGAKLDAPRITYEHDDAPWADWLYRGTRHESALEVSPFLIQPSPTSRLWDNQPDWCEAGIVLKTRSTPEELMGHLRSLISIRLPSGQLSYCRFYSVNRLNQLLSVFNDAQLSAFVGPVEEWRNPSVEQSWELIETRCDSKARLASEEGWFHLTQENLDALNRQQQDSFLSRLKNHLDSKFVLQKQIELERLVQDALQYGFESERDLARYAELAVRHPHRFSDRRSLRILSQPHTTNFQKLNQLDDLLAYGDAK